MSKLEFEQTRIIINVTGKAPVKDWPKSDAIDQIHTLKQTHVESVANHLKLPTNDTNPPRLALNVKRHLEEFSFPEEKCEIKGYWVKLYDYGYFVFSLELFLSTLVPVKQINKYINDILKNEVIKFKGKDIGFINLSKAIVEDLLKELNMQKDSDKSENVETFEDYSIISPKYIRPDSFNPENVIETEYEYDLYEAAIRRMPDLSDIRMDLTRSEQKNISIHKGDMVYLNYHNLFAYISDNPEHISLDVYASMMEFYKIYIARLIYVFKYVSVHLSQMGPDVPDKLKDLKNESDWIESARLKELRAYEKFQNAVNVASTRIIWFKLSAHNKFRIDDERSKLKESLDSFEATISRRVLLKQNEFIQEQNKSIQEVSAKLAKYTIFITFIGVLVAAVGIVIGIIKSQVNAHDTQSQLDKNTIQIESIDSLSSEFNTVEEDFD